MCLEIKCSIDECTTSSCLFTTVFTCANANALLTVLLRRSRLHVLSCSLRWLGFRQTPSFLLHAIPDESDSDEDCDGYLNTDEGPVAYRSIAEFEEL